MSALTVAVVFIATLGALQLVGFALLASLFAYVKLDERRKRRDLMRTLEAFAREAQS